MKERCDKCGKKPTLVGYGRPPVWLCGDCYEAELRRVGSVLRPLTTEVAK